MKEIELPYHVKYFGDVRSSLIEQGVEHTYFSGTRSIAFANDEDAVAFMLRIGGIKGETLNTFRDKFTSEVVEARFNKDL